MTKLITQNNGPQIRGEVVQDLEDEIIVLTNMGRLIIDKDNIVSMIDVLNCKELPLGTYVKTAGTTYLKISPTIFRTVQKDDESHLLPIDIDCIDEGEILDHEQVWPGEV